MLFLSSKNKIQPKLAIGQPNDRYEQEADAVADHVMKTPVSGMQPIQRKCDDCEQESLQMKSLSPTITPILQKQEEDEVFQMKGISNVAGLDGGLESSLQQSRGGGQTMDTSTQQQMSSSIGADFSKVKIHTDNNAIRMSQQLNAKAFTNGADVYFNQGQYNPESSEGKHLLAHELTHVVQQSGGGRTIQRKPLPIDMLPNYSQEGDTCGATSLVTALMIYDKQNKNFDTTLAAHDIILTWLIQHKKKTIKLWTKKGLKGEKLYGQVFSVLQGTRDNLAKGIPIQESEYQVMGMALYLLYVDKTSGLSASEIEGLQRKLGLYNGKSDLIDNGGEVFSNSVVANLQPGQIAQIAWYVKTSGPDKNGNYNLGPHAFLIGRLNTGGWFLHDQGPRPAARFVDGSLAGLESQVRVASSKDKYWLFFGKFAMKAIGVWTGAKLLDDSDGPMEKQGGLVPKGTYLAEIDYSSFRGGEAVNLGAYLGVAHDYSDANGIAGEKGGFATGRLIIEMPKGAFLVYETNKISTYNMAANEIDKSGGGALTKKQFYRADLIIGDGKTQKKFKVY